MNKQELIQFVTQQQKKIDNFDFTDVEDSDRADYLANVMYVNYKNLLDELKKLDEPLKVKVPAIIYMWLYYCKGNNYALKAALDEGNMRSYQRATGREGLQKWFESKENQDLFSKAWSNGYEEEEQKYYIKLMDKPVDKHENYLVYEIEEDRYFLDHPSRNNSRYQMHFTEDEIKEIDERYWPFAVPVEKV